MVNIVKTEGIVLKGMDLLETSRIVTLYSQKFGKIKLFAKGIRRPKSKFGSSLETLTRSSVIFYKREQKDLYTVSESSILNPYKNLKEDLMGYGYASVLLDFLDKANPGEGINPRLYRLSLGTLKAMERCLQMRNSEFGVGNSALRTPHSALQMLLWSFLWRGISLVGFKPELERCVSCKKSLPTHKLIDSSTHQRIKWSSSLGGILCRECRSKDEEAREISGETFVFLKTLENGSTPIRNFQMNDEPFQETKDLIQEFLSYHLDKRLLSFAFIRSLQDLTT